MEGYRTGSSSVETLSLPGPVVALPSTSVCLPTTIRQLGPPTATAGNEVATPLSLCVASASLDDDQVLGMDRRECAFAPLPLLTLVPDALSRVPSAKRD